MFECADSSMAKYSYVLSLGLNSCISLCSVFACLGVVPCMGLSNVQHCENKTGFCS